MELEGEDSEALDKEEIGNTENDGESETAETPMAAPETAKAAAAPRPHVNSRVSFMLNGSRVKGGVEDLTEELPQPESAPEPQPTASTEGQWRSSVVDRLPRMPPVVNFLEETPYQELEEEDAASAFSSPQHETTQQSRRLSTRDSLQGLQLSRSLPEAMALLSATTKDLQGRVNLLLAQHEDDFFVAFRTHMTEVQKHIECLRDSADAQKNLMARDLRVKTLQNELKWFVEEALRLDQVCKKLRGDLINWQARTEALREDRDFLERELKTTKRKLRNIQLQQQCITVAEATQKPSGVALPSTSGAASGCQPASRPERKLRKNSVEAPQLLDQPGDDAAALKEVVEGLKRQVASLTAANRRLQNQAKRNTRMGSCLVEASKALGRRRDLEAFFVECINDVKKERKLRGATTCSVEDFKQLSLEEFLAFDRRRVLNALLSSDVVLRKLYGLLFPHQAAME